MKRILFSLIFSVFLIGGSFSFAEEKVKSDAELMIEAVVYGAQADAFSAHCGDEPTFAGRFIQKFSERKDATEKVIAYLVELQQENFIKMSKVLESSEKGCKDLEVMMRRLEVMQKLKETSYLLNGVDPKDIPKNDLLPELEGMLSKEGVGK